MRSVVLRVLLMTVDLVIPVILLAYLKKNLERRPWIGGVGGSEVILDELEIYHKLNQPTPVLLYKVLTILIAFVWLINGLWCKLLNGVPRHQEIVARILGDEHATLLIKLIGLGEVGIAIWVLSNIQPRYCVIVQIGLVAIMNILEFVLAPDLLLFGKMNVLFALLFILLLYIYAFKIRSTISK